MKTKLFTIQTLLYLALVLALLSSLRHVAFAFSTVNGGNWPESYLSAVAIDIGLLALAAGINRRKAQHRNTRILWAGVALFSSISVYANWLSGAIHVSQLSASITGLSAILFSLRPILLSSVLPVLVIYLSEIATDNAEFSQAQEDRLAKRLAKRQFASEIANPGVEVTSEIANPESQNDDLDVINSQRLASKQEKMTQLANLLANLPDATNGQLANQLGVSEATIRNYKTQLATNGNGKVM